MTVPASWICAPLGAIANVQMGQSPDSSTYNDSEQGLPFFQGKAEFGRRSPTARKWCTSPAKIAEPGDILLSIRAPVGPINVADTRCAIGRGLAAIAPLAGVKGSYLVHALRYLEPQLASKATGTTFPAVGGEVVRALEVPLAPEREQKRIAEKIDNLLTRVDDVNSRLACIAPILKHFRQSVLAAATSGRFTEDWRQEVFGTRQHEYQITEISVPYPQRITGPKGWKPHTFDQAVDLVGGSQPPKSTFVHEEQPDYVRLIQIRDYKSDRHLTYIPRALARRFCSATDVMIGRYGPPIFQILRGLEGAYNVALMRAVPKGDLLTNDYLYYWLQRDDLLKFVEAGSDRTAGQDGVRKEHLIKYPIFVPSVPEQAEIVRRVETLFAFADRLEARLRTAQSATERLTPALLAKAFRGELVPQDPNDEPASELLRRLQQEAPSTSTRRGRKSAA